MATRTRATAAQTSEAIADELQRIPNATAAPQRPTPAAEWRMPVPQNGGFVTGDDSDDEPDPEQSVVDRIRAMSGGQSTDKIKIKIYRQKPNGGGLEFCGDYNVPEFEAGDLAMIRRDWGAGDYQIRVIGSTGILMRETVAIAPMLNAAPAPVQAENSELSQVLRMLAEGQNAILQALTTRPDPNASMRESLQNMVLMREAMGITNNPAPAPAQSSTAMLTELVQAVKTLRDVSDEINPKAPAIDTDNPMAMLPGVLDLVKTAMGNRQSQSAPMIALPGSFADISEHAQPNPAQMPGDVAQNSNQQTEGEPMGVLILRGLMSKLLGMAATGKSSDEGAEFIADKLPDEILQYLDLPNWFDILCSFAPDCAKHREWLTEAKAKADALLDAPDDEPAERHPG
jgi:hypothetical protein